MTESFRSAAPDAAADLPVEAGEGDAAARLTLLYMTVALVGLVLAGDGDARQRLILAGHVGLWCGLLLSVRGNGRLALPARAWVPLVSIPLLYAELPYLMAIVGAQYGDAAVQRWEAALWGEQPSQTLARSAPWLWISEPLHLAYLSYYAIIYAPLAMLWWRGKKAAVSLRDPHGAGGAVPRDFAEASAAVMLAFIVCFIVFIVFPVQGPRYLWAADVPDGPVRGAVLAILERGSSRGAAFPSSHMAVAVVQALMAARWRLPGWQLIALLTAGLGVGAVYGGFHYAIDMIAGAVVGGLVFVSVRRFFRRRPQGLKAGGIPTLPPSRT